MITDPNNCENIIKIHLGAGAIIVTIIESKNWKKPVIIVLRAIKSLLFAGSWIWINTLDAILNIVFIIKSIKTQLGNKISGLNKYKYIRLPDPNNIVLKIEAKKEKLTKGTKSSFCS